MTDTTDLAIVGGGAAGLAAAIFAAQTANPARPFRIVLLDSAKTLGAKILVAGGGRCNVTHHAVTPDDYNGPRTIIRNILAAFDADAAVRWFASLGVELKREETGKLFPVTDSARTVLSALLCRCAELGVQIQTASRVTNITPPSETNPFFTIEHTDPASSSPHLPSSLRAARIILATGGRSLPRSGSDGFGWELIRRLGHTVTPTYAALVPLILDNTPPGMFHAELSGLSQQVELSTYAGNKRIDRRTGSLLWTHFGISGPVVMDASRHWVIAHESGGRPEMRCNLLPGETFDSAESWLIDQAAARPRTSLLNILSTARIGDGGIGRWGADSLRSSSSPHLPTPPSLPERMIAALLTRMGIPASTPASQLARDARRALVHALTELPLPIVRQRGWNYAEVTAGGVPLAEIDYRTMQSRKLPSLYVVGEMLDCDGRIGGFNFQWAWATGYLAGKAAAKSLGSRR